MPHQKNSRGNYRIATIAIPPLINVDLLGLREQCRKYESKMYLDAFLSFLLTIAINFVSRATY
jgi:hypothetical protein